ncbi:MAG: alcohol dehydrogenase catalytic domain-containing protein [Anaerolineae bacterium]|nr:alcohol dehydrogenase catalytic domain-containing protein [Anaerolineae bacterium]
MARAAFYEHDKTIRVGDVEAPVPGPGEVQVKIAYAGICGTDLHIYHGVMDQRVAASQIMGHEVSGVVSALGEGVVGIEVGQMVTVMPLDPCNACPACEAGYSHICLNLKFLGIDTQGGFQSYWTVPAHTIFPLPETMSLKRAALVEPLAVACHDVRLGEVKAGEFVVVLGGGPIGALVGLVAQNEGAEVIVSEINPDRIRIGRELGLEVVDPNEVDLVALVNERTGGAGADVVFEVTGSAAGAATMTQLPRTRGRIVVVAIFGHVPPVDLKAILWREMKLRGTRVYERQDFEKAIKLASGDALPLDLLITGIYPLERLKDALTELEQGGNAMKILIDVAA